MSEPVQNAIVQRIIEVFNVPRDRRAQDQDLDFEYHSDSSNVRMNLQSLIAEYGERQLTDVVISVLEACSDAYEIDEMPTEVDTFIANCCLSMVLINEGVDVVRVTEVRPRNQWEFDALTKVEDGIVLSKPLVQKLIRTFPSIYYYRVLTQFIRRYLTDLETLEALADGLLSKSRFTGPLCVAGLRLYAGYATKDPDRQKFAEVLEETHRRIDLLAEAAEAEFREDITVGHISLEGWTH